MIARGIRLTPLRCEVLGALTSGQGVSADELKRRVGTGRGLSPESPGWAPFTVSFARALRLLEGKGALEVARDDVLFGHACATWVRLTPQGESERARVLARDERGLGKLTVELVPGVPGEWRAWLGRASEPELAALEGLIEGERTRRAAGSLF